MPSEVKKERQKVVVEEVVEEVMPQPTIEVPAETKPHIEPGIHEETTPVPMPMPIPITPPSVGPNPLFIIIPGIFLLGALLGGIIYYQKTASTQSPKTSSASTLPEETVSPSPTPNTTVDLGKYDLKVLNGSGIAGEAGKAQTLLENKGFDVTTTGNATSYSFTKTVIQTKSDVDSDFIAKLIETLGETYMVDSKTQNITGTSEESVVVIIGSSKK